ncbi:hypothetical protein [Actinoplanes sp. CA-252034]|uniref:hypothetical protein n=1 Tax=Actinoplanes sp. CA-252034 TaxID=3239906 RepID=UPI003D98EE42
MTLATDSGRPIRIGHELAKGGQGEVLLLADPPGFVLKRYFPEEIRKDPTLERRLMAMTRHRPAHSGKDASGHLTLSWPIEVARDRRVFTGFLMPLIDVSATVELHRLANPSERPRTAAEGWITAFTWGHRVASAANLARATATLHDAGTVIGDFNERNIRISRTTLVTLLDCDSMQVADPATGELFLCRVGRPEYTAPELLGADWSRTVRQPSSDLFALAIHIYQLLMGGEHPFRGIWSGPGDKPASTALASRGVWAHGGGPLQPRPHAVAEWLLPREIMDLFRRAFEHGARQPDARPTAAEWEQALRRLAADTRGCPATPQHVFAAGLRACPWCDRAARSQAARNAPPAQAGAGIWAPAPAPSATGHRDPGPVGRPSAYPSSFSAPQSQGLVPGSEQSKRLAWIVALSAVGLLLMLCLCGNLLSSGDTARSAPRSLVPAMTANN